MASKDRETVKLLTNLGVIKRVMRESKGRAIRKGIKDKNAIASHIINDALSFRGRSNDDAVWFGMALQIAGNSRDRESNHADDVDEFEPQSVFDLDAPIPIQHFAPIVLEMDDGCKAVQRPSGWMLIDPAGDEAPADRRQSKYFDQQVAREQLKPKHDRTDVVRVRDFRIYEGDQRTKQMEINLERDHRAYDRWVKGWSLVRPLLVEHPSWSLGMAVDDLRDRGEWPSELDDEG